jgi:hypothetical protein
MMPEAALPQMMPDAALPLVSRDLLRSVCEPFFEMMLTALQHALHQQTHLAGVEAATAQTSSSSTPPPTVAQSAHPESISQRELTPEGHHKEAAEASAVASVSLRSEELNLKAQGAELIASLTSTLGHSSMLSSAEDVEQLSDSDKSNAVCRHWKSKGWCRLRSECKFQHPESKRGILAPKVKHSSSVVSKAPRPVKGANSSVSEIGGDGQMPHVASDRPQRKNVTEKSPQLQHSTGVRGDATCALLRLQNMLPAQETLPLQNVLLQHLAHGT